MGKLENHWFKHDINASNDAKIQKLEFRLGLEGYAIFFKIVEVLMQNNGYIENDLNMLAYQLKIDDLEALRATINDFGLFDVTESEITNRRVSKQLEEITEKSQKARENAKRRWGNT